MAAETGSSSKSRFQRGYLRLCDLFAEEEAYVGQEVTVCGLIRTIRVQGKKSLGFVKLSDGTCPFELQGVCRGGQTEDLSEGQDGGAVLFERGGTGVSVRLTGRIVVSPGKGQTIEMQVTHAHVYGGVADPSTYPITKKDASLEYLRTVAHLRPRTAIFGAVTRVRDALSFATHQFFHKKLGFKYIHTPIITSADCEGAGEAFSVTTIFDGAGKGVRGFKDGSVDYEQDFFKRQAWLTVSGQLDVECFATAVGDVYTFGPTFRAEDSHTTRHLSEFWMIEPEIAFAGLEENMALAEDYLKHCLVYVSKHCAGDLKLLEEYESEHRDESRGTRYEWQDIPLRVRLGELETVSYARIPYTEAIQLLEAAIAEGRAEFVEKVYWGCDLASEHERWLTEKHFGRPTFVTHYPKELKAKYMKADPPSVGPDGQPRETVQAMDLLVPGIGELIGGSAREDDYEKLKEHKELPDWYLDLRKYGSIPHAGFGVGFERMVMLVTGMKNIRDTIPFPRYPGHCEY